MEHSTLSDIFKVSGIVLSPSKEKQLLRYGALILSENQKYNLTGLKTIDGIVERLIIGSIQPLSDMIVPRGTVFADIGSGAGIPGIPLAIYHDGCEGILMESNRKKVLFMNAVIRELMLTNVRVHHGRVEDTARGDMRESCDLVVSRALGDIYIALEIGAPLLRQGGLLYVYSHDKPGNLPQFLTEQINDVGCMLLDSGRYGEFGIKNTGLLFYKAGTTDPTFPRKMSVIKRELRRLNGKHL